MHGTVSRALVKQLQKQKSLQGVRRNMYNPPPILPAHRRPLNLNLPKSDSHTTK